MSPEPFTTLVAGVLFVFGCLLMISWSSSFVKQNEKSGRSLVWFFVVLAAAGIFGIVRALGQMLGS